MANRIASLLRRSFSSLGNQNVFESSISLKKLYPNSSLDIARYIQPPTSKSNGSFTGYIPINELNVTYSRSGGPGGQNVNKVNTKVDIRFHVESAKWLPDDLKPRLMEKHKNSINSEGYFVIKSDRTRSQQLNLADALDKLRYIIHRTEAPIPAPSYKDLEIKRRRLEKSSRERLRLKRDRSLVKQDRQGSNME
ncbi:Peptidyl-tRNA hydrolase ICT1, mitochondrial [Armadillidium vulgare]|nr:Peptidyl-tRNA hydrolase ICT1, mitochondrial [Armadillidium vulgare]RXG58633.1 Peptidyl-tRNA hydrolase ICT1, mitochondrial [Armadillidium vulgare]